MVACPNMKLRTEPWVGRIMNEDIVEDDFIVKSNLCWPFPLHNCLVQTLMLPTSQQIDITMVTIKAKLFSYISWHQGQITSKLSTVCAYWVVMSNLTVILFCLAFTILAFYDHISCSGNTHCYFGVLFVLFSLISSR